MCKNIIKVNIYNQLYVDYSDKLTYKLKLIQLSKNYCKYRNTNKNYFKTN